MLLIYIYFVLSYDIFQLFLCNSVENVSACLWRSNHLTFHRAHSQAIPEETNTENVNIWFKDMFIHNVYLKSQKLQKIIFQRYSCKTLHNMENILIEKRLGDDYF